MNLRYYYYHRYFEGVDLRQPKEKEARKTLEKNNEPVLKAKNARLRNALPPRPAPNTLGNVSPRLLTVQNPGLLPGIGYPHEIGYAGEFKLGFHFDFTTGLPALPGSTIKGVVRSLFPQFEYDEKTPADFQAASRERTAALQARKADFMCQQLQKLLPGETFPEDKAAFCHRLELALFDGWNAESLDTEAPRRDPLSSRAVFFDALPVGYDSGLLGRDAITPHHNAPLKNPTPLPFLKVLPGVQFEFHFRLFPLTIQTVALPPEKLCDLLVVLIRYAGIGAKTNVGYGQLQ